MENFDGVYPLDVIDELKQEGGGLYEIPKRGSKSRCNGFNEPTQVVGIDERILHNLADPEQNQEIEISNDYSAEEIQEEDIDQGTINTHGDIEIITIDGAASCCTADQMYAGLENLG